MPSMTGPFAIGSDSEREREAVAAPESPRVREYFDLRDALSDPGCPVCARVDRAGREALETLAAEASSTAPARKTGLGLRGLCSIHAWSLLQVSEKRIGPAEAYEAFLRGRMAALDRTLARSKNAPPGSWSSWIGSWADTARTWMRLRRGRRRCPACRSALAVERRDLCLFPDLITDMEFARAFEASTGLCLPHLNLCVRLQPDHPDLPRLLEAHVLKAKRLQADLQDFIRRVKAPFGGPTHEEQRAIWDRVLEWTAGKPGVFGPERELVGQPGVREVRLGRVPWTAVRRRPTPVIAEGEQARMGEVERLSLENAKLQRRLMEVNREWGEESARRAAFQYQVHKLSEDVKVLELNLAGARGEAKAGDIQAKRLRDENEALQETVRRLGDGNSPGTARLER